MSSTSIRSFAVYITRLINKENLTRQEAFDAFSIVLNNQTTEIQQGAFLAALTAKGETTEEIASCWEAIYQFDTVKVVPNVSGPIVENCGTGMDSFKTFNISTAASIVAASQGIAMARHGARALTSKCGTVDMAEALGVDMECDVRVGADSLERCNLALFNGMSPCIHPMALGRILSQIAFGSTLNIAASLASPVKANVGVRGVYAQAMIAPVVLAMKEIGYERALVVHGAIDNQVTSMDEASVCGETHCAELKEDGTISQFSFRPEDVGLRTQAPHHLESTGDIKLESKKMVDLLGGDGQTTQTDAVALNTGLIFYATNAVSSLKEGTQKALKIIKSGKAIDTLTQWVGAQNSEPQRGMAKLNELLG